jgi:hypothetical protein
LVCKNHDGHGIAGTSDLVKYSRPTVRLGRWNEWSIWKDLVYGAHGITWSRRHTAELGIGGILYDRTWYMGHMVELVLRGKTVRFGIGGTWKNLE